MARSEILKRVQDDVGGVFAASPMANVQQLTVVVLQVGIPLKRYSFILLLQNKKGIFFACFVKKISEQVDLVMNALFFCVARKIFLLRHAVIFPLPCAWRGVKIFFELVYDFPRYSQRVLFSSFFAIAIANANSQSIAQCVCRSGEVVVQVEQDVIAMYWESMFYIVLNQRF